MKLLTKAEVAEQALRLAVVVRVTRPTVRRRANGGTFLARYRMNGRQREVSLGTADEFEAKTMAARLYDRLSNLHRGDGPGVYLLRGVGGLKIGRASKSIASRVSAIGTANAGGVTLVAVLSPDPEDEKIFHRGMAKFRLRGEWFRDEPASVAHLAHLLEGGLR